MHREPLSLRHQELLSARLKALDIQLSEYNFSTLYLFRKVHEYEVLFEEEEVWIEGITHDGTRHLMPTTDLREFDPQKLVEKLSGVDCFYPIPESWAEGFEKSFFSLTYNRADSDYIFMREKIATYPGRNLSPKRNLLKQFLYSYTPTIVPYRSELLKDAFVILDEWEENNKGKTSDYHSCKEAFEQAERLDLVGYLFYLEEKPIGLLLGEKARSDLFIYHFAKANTQYKGIYAYLFREVARQIAPERITWLNWEQDLGIRGLRQSKKSYQPDEIAHKMRLSLQK